MYYDPLGYFSFGLVMIILIIARANFRKGGIFRIHELLSSYIFPPAESKSGIPFRSRTKKKNWNLHRKNYLLKKRLNCFFFIFMCIK